MKTNSAMLALLTASDMTPEQRVNAAIAALAEGEVAVTLRAGSGVKLKPEAAEFLLRALSAGAVPRQQVLKAGAAEGFTAGDLTIAAGHSGVQSRRFDSTRVLWSLPEAGVE